MLLIATFMFDPAKLHTNCAAASGSSIFCGETETFLLLTSAPARRDSNPFDGFEPAVADGLHEPVVVLLVAVGVSLGEVRDRPFELVALSEVPPDRDGIAGSRVRAGERPRAGTPVELELGHAVGLHFGRALHVAELPPVEVARHVQTLRPAQEDVARGLHHPLTRDDALSVLTETALRQMILENRRRRLLDLEEQRILLIAALE